MSHKEALADLKICVGRESNYRWHGERGLATVRAGADVKLVERAMKIVLPWSPVAACRKLHDDYVPIAWRVLGKVTDNCEVTFLCLYEGTDDAARLRAGAAWLHESHMLDDKPRNRRRLPGLVADVSGLAAARATVVKHGAEAERLLAVLAHDGTADSIDAIVDVVHEAIDKRGELLDTMLEWFVPFVRGKDMTALAAELTAARDARGSASPLTQLFGGKGKRLAFELMIDSRQVQVGLTRRAHAHVHLRSHALPNAEASVSRNNRRSPKGFDYTRWEDGRRLKDENRVGYPSSLEDLPRWLAHAATKLKVTWDRSTLLVTSTLRGKAREQAIDWLFPQ